MAYLTCPDCRMPNSAADDSPQFLCLSCYSQIVFHTCQDCEFRQAIPQRWLTAFTCGKCDAKVDIPRTRSYAMSTKARDVQGYGYQYPRML